MSICIKDQIQNMNLVIGCTVGCAYCYARNNVKRWHMIDDFADPEFFPGKLRMMEKKRPQNFLLTGMSDLSGWKPEWRDEVFAKIRENPQHQFLFLTKRPDLLDFDTDLENAWFGVTVTRKAELWRIDALRKNVRAKHYHVTFEPLFDDPGTVDLSGINWIVVGTMTGAQSRKIHTVKAMERRFEKEDENMTQMPEQEEAIFVKLGDENSHIPAGKTVIEYELSKLVTPDGKRILAEGIHLKIKGSEKICMIGANGAGKTTLLKKIAEELLNRNDIKAEYMPQTYEDLLDLDVTPVDYLDKTGDKEERTRIRTYLGSLKYTPDEMEHPIRELSGGQKAKVLLLRMSLSGANVLILDEPTRNFSPLSGPVIRKMLREFPGAVISISHDRKYIEEVCDKIYQLNPNGLQLIGD